MRRRLRRLLLLGLVCSTLPTAFIALHSLEAAEPSDGPSGASGGVPPGRSALSVSLDRVWLQIKEFLGFPEPVEEDEPDEPPPPYDLRAILAGFGRANCSGCRTNRIPHILHQVYLDGEEAYNEETRHAEPAFRREWRDSCVVHHARWEHRFWTRASAEAFLQTRYPWFLPTFRAYKQLVHRSDALRIFLMDAFGGLYVDMDVECFRNGEDMLAGHDLVLQGTVGEEGVTNAVMASAPGHPFWREAMRLLEERALLADDHPINKTGPGIITSVLEPLIERPPARNLAPGQWYNFREEVVGLWHHPAGGSIRVYPIRSWFCPCWFIDKACHLWVAKSRAEGSLPFNLVGYHRFSGSWNGYTGRWLIPRMGEFLSEALTFKSGKIPL